MEPQRTIDSLFRMYREAIQTNDYRQAVQTLRNLDKVDPSQNWKGNLVQAEKAFQVQLESAFEDALGKNDAQTAANLAREYLAEPWLITPMGGAATAMRAYIGGFEAAQGHKALRIKQRPMTEVTPSPASTSEYLAPPHQDKRKFGIIVAACVVTILALAAGFFVVWQDGEKKKRKAEEQAEMLRQQEAESAQKGAMLENAITNLALVVNQAIGQLEKMKSKIRTTDNPDHFANEELPMEQGKVRDARRTAKSQGVADDILASYEERFDKAVAEVDIAIKKRKLELDAVRKNEQPLGEPESGELETGESELDKDGSGAEASDDTHLPFSNADAVRVVGINELKDHDFIRRYAKMTVFYYADGDRKDFASEEVSMKKMGTSCIWSPKPEDVVRKSTGLFTIWYSEKDKTAYWVWNLPRGAEHGEKWFQGPNDEDERVRIDMKQTVFGNSSSVYGLYVKHLGNPTYVVARSQDGDAGIGIALRNQTETSDNLVSDKLCKLFRPDEEVVAQYRAKLEAVIDNQRTKIVVAKSEVERLERVVRELERDVSTFKRLLSDYARSRDREEKARKASRYGDVEIENAARRTKEIMLAMQEVATKIVASVKEMQGMTFSEKELLRCNNPDEVDTLLKSRHIFDSNGNVLRKDLKIAVKAAQDDLEKAKKSLADFEANFEKQWREVAEESRYAVTAVRGSKESGKARK